MKNNIYKVPPLYVMWEQSFSAFKVFGIVVMILQ